MRDFLNDILEFIGAETLTDEEFEQCEEDLGDYGDNVQTYRTLKEVLTARDSSSDTLYQLAFYFLAKGVTVASVNTSQPADDSSPVQAQSQILIGIAL